MKTVKKKVLRPPPPPPRIGRVGCVYCMYIVNCTVLYMCTLRTLLPPPVFCVRAHVYRAYSSAADFPHLRQYNQQAPLLAT